MLALPVRPGRVPSVRTWLLQPLGFLLSAVLAFASQPEVAAVPSTRHVYVIPIRDQIGSAVLYVVRRGLKEAIDAKADAVVFDMKTPGGALDSTLEIMEAIGKFPGPTYTYVNNEAMSAGAFIAATTDEIWFAPTGIIGAAAPVASGGQDVEATMKQKVVSYLKARIRSMSEGKGFRGQVVSAMIDADTELKIDDQVIKGKGELLSLTAAEATKKYGDPPVTLLGAGVAPSIAGIFARKFDGASITTTTLALTWSERLAVWLTAMSPILMGLGMLALFIEFKTPGFGVFGITGIALLAIVFLGNYVAGLSGHEPILFFGLGLLLVALEIFFFPGVAIFAVTGLALIIGSLVWSMADLWPNQPIAVAWHGDVFVSPLVNFGLGILVALLLGAALARFIPKGWFFSRLAIAEGASGAAQLAGARPDVVAELDQLIGREAVAATGLFPSGQVEIDGRRFEARVEVGAVPAGTRLVVRRRTDFGLIVEPQGGTRA